MLKINNIYKSYDGKFVLAGISTQFYKGDKVGLIGENGIGKSTLLRLILKKEYPDEGSIIWQESLKIAYMAQVSSPKREKVKDVLTKIKAQLLAKQHQDIGLAKELKIFMGDLEKKLNQIAKIEGDLSGGEKTKLALMETLSQDAEVYILDEPTNHLDTESIEQLIRIIKGSSKTYMIISHDRYFLNKTVNKVYELTKGRMGIYPGHYDDYKRQKEHEILSHEKAYKKQKNIERHLEDAIMAKRSKYSKSHNQAGQNDFYRSKAKKQVNAMKNMERRLDKIKREGVDQLEERIDPAFNRINEFIEKAHLPKILMRCEELGIEFDGTLLFEDINVAIRRNQHIALLGSNGSGKTTLLRLLVGELRSSRGLVKVSPSVKIGYFAQELGNLCQDNSIYEEVRVPHMEQGEVRKLLANFLFRREKVFTKIKDLSMGEKCRVAFVKLLVRQNNVLVLDEITNHMDIQSKECLEEALKLFKGTVIFVSHDLYFINKIATKIIRITNKSIEQFSGSYREYTEEEKQRAIKEKSKANNDGVDYEQLKNQLRMVEMKCAYINGKLCSSGLKLEEKLELESEFFSMTKELRRLRSAVHVHC